MSTVRAHSAEFLPLLSRGRHRRPKSGACLMEYASYLAGEKWSDHPACTHPLLAELARQVNDFTSDATRQTLVELLPDLIGRTGTDLHIDVRIALRAARTALPIAAEGHQRIMAAGILTCERFRAALDGCPDAPLSRESTEALALAPDAAAWARSFTRRLAISHRVFCRQTAPTIVRYAVQGIAQACVPARDVILRELLVGAIDDFDIAPAPQPGRVAGPGRSLTASGAEASRGPS
jgi:hypothetical protein